MNKKIIAIISWFLCLIIILGAVCYITVPQYDSKEARATLGEVYSLNEGWTITYSDDTYEQKNMPFVVSGKKAQSLVLENTISKDYSGLALSFSVKNAAMHVLVNGKPIYEAGYITNSDNTPNLGQTDIQPEDTTQEDTETASPAPSADAGAVSFRPESTNSGTLQFQEQDRLKNTEERLKNRSKNATRIESEENLIDLPNIEKDASIRILLDPVDTSRSIVIKRATIAKRDATVINRMRSVVFPMLCMLLILITLTIMVVMDFARLISGTGRHGIFRLIFFSIDIMIYCTIQTGIATTFVGNVIFFGALKDMCFLMMPVLLNFYFEKRIAVHYPKRMYALLWSSTAIALLSLALHIRGIDKYSPLTLFPPASLLCTIAIMTYTIYKWNQEIRPERHTIFEVISLLCLAVAAICMPVQRFISNPPSYMSTIVIASVTLFFFFLTIQEIKVMLFEYKEKISASAQVLEEQNRQLTKAKEEAEEARHEAILANEAKGKFLANMSHEIRTPINAVLGMDEMILRESREKDIRGYAADIFTAGQTLLSLINDILDFSKIESGKMEIIPVDYDISSLIHDLSNMITQRAKAKDLVFEVSAASNIPARFWGDDVRIRQVLTNILTNSVKYTQEGKIWFRISGTREGEYELLHFEVEDTGIGIKEEDIPKLFAAYERIEESRNRNIEGTGLGMNITTQLLHLMGGKLDVKSVYGKGSTFSIDIKQKIMDETPLGDFNDRISALQENYTYEEAFRAPEARVLVVDDNSMNRKVFASFLKLTEIQIDEAESGKESIRLASQNYYDIIFMDHMMPEMDGVEAMHHIKAMDGPCKDTPIFVLTANAVTGAKEEYLKEGFNGFLSKPVAAKKLEDAIRKTLNPALLLPARENRDDLDTGLTEAPDDLPAVDGLDWNIAYLHLPGTELVSSTVQEFYKLLPVHAEKLQGFYTLLLQTEEPVSISDMEALDSYRIQVHAMKSMAATIGIIPLAGMAKILEYAARDKDAAIVRSMHDIFMKEWYSYEAKLNGVFGIGKEAETKKESINPNVLKALFEMLQNAMDDFDVDTADETMEKIMQYGYDENTLGKLKKMQAAVADLDGDLVAELAEEITLTL